MAASLCVAPRRRLAAERSSASKADARHCRIHTRLRVAVGRERQEGRKEGNGEGEERKGKAKVREDVFLRESNRGEKEEVLNY